ncbi:MAG: damage-control phosphatase ARMT1 family protein [Candidatus Helarchaeota archaeon]
MKIRPRCSVCLLQRALKEVRLATDDKELQFAVLKAVIDFFATEFKKDAVSAILGTKRDRIIRQMTNCTDPYKELKKQSNEIALELIQPLEKILKTQKDPYKRFRYAVLVAIVGNILEFDILEHEISLDNSAFLQETIAKAEEDLAIDHILQIFQLIQAIKEVLFLTDNAGEIVFDKLLIRELLQQDINVTIAVKGFPALNDATLEDAEIAGLIELSQQDSNLEIITTGSDHIGLILSEITDPFRTYFENARLIIAKGMGYYETLTENAINIPVVHLFRTKCSSVAEDVGVQIGQNVALLRNAPISEGNNL